MCFGKKKKHAIEKMLDEKDRDTEFAQALDRMIKSGQVTQERAHEIYGEYEKAPQTGKKK